MESVIGPIIMGIFILLLGIANRKGNLSSIHWYHRQRVSEEDREAFGKMIGLGTIIIGISVMVFGCFTFLAEISSAEIYDTIGSAIVIIGIVIGLGLSLYAMIKYNKGIF